VSRDDFSVSRDDCVFEMISKYRWTFKYHYALGNGGMACSKQRDDENYNYLSLITGNKVVACN
jgi:hypothetical protein